MHYTLAVFYSFIYKIVFVLASILFLIFDSNLPFITYHLKQDKLH